MSEFLFVTRTIVASAASKFGNDEPEAVLVHHRSFLEVKEYATYHGLILGEPRLHTNHFSVETVDGRRLPEEQISVLDTVTKLVYTARLPRLSTV